MKIKKKKRQPFKQKKKIERAPPPHEEVPRDVDVMRKFPQVCNCKFLVRVPLQGRSVTGNCTLNPCVGKGLHASHTFDKKCGERAPTTGGAANIILCTFKYALGASGAGAPGGGGARAPQCHSSITKYSRVGG